MKTRPAAPRGPALSPTDKLPIRIPEAVGRIAAVARAAEGSTDQTYTGEDRRRKDRREASKSTTLDTRKTGPDRRLTGRINLKV